MTYNPWLDAHQRYPEVHIEWHRIAPAQAFWDPATDVIIVDETISRAARRCALAHEIAHLDAGDRPDAVGWFSTRQEHLADGVAARRLVSVDDLMSAARYCDDPREIAADLEVTVDVLRLRWRHMHPAERGTILRSVSRREAVA